MVERIEKIVNGDVVQWAWADKLGRYHCYPNGQTIAAHRVYCATLDEAAHYLTKIDPRGRIRMTPGRALIADGIHIDGRPREQL